MKKIYVLLIFILTILSIFVLGGKVQAAELDKIVNYVVTVDPRMTDGSLDITYEITWKVLDSTTEGPLEWVKIGTPNSNFDTPTALTNNIAKIEKYSGSYVRIDFTKKHYAGEIFTFKYSIHQSYMYTISAQNCKYEFTPAWFTDSRIDSLTVKWNAQDVIKSDATAKDGNYLVWRKSNMEKGSKLKTSIQYPKKAFTALNEAKQAKKNSESSMNTFFYAIFNLLSVIGAIIVIIIIIVNLNNRGGGGYYRHSGFYGGFYGGRSCVRSSCACACAHSSCASSCACACAGSGRAGCSKKDFYGTNLTTNKLKKAMKI